MTVRSDEALSGAVETLELGLEEVERLAANLAVFVGQGDVLCLKGDLGAGKTTFARAFIRSLLDDGDGTDIPSPSFALVQTYETARFGISHYDFYRIGAADEVLELGVDEAVDQGIVLIEWPEKAEEYLPKDTLNISLNDSRGPYSRVISLSGTGYWADKLKRFFEVNRFLEDAGWSQAQRRFLQGDASPRKYTRLEKDGQIAVLMDAPKQPDGPPVRDGKAYSQIAHLAENVTPFYAIGNALEERGVHTPQIYAHDLEDGFLLLEDLGDGVFGQEIQKGANIKALYYRAVDVLTYLRLKQPDTELELPSGGTFKIPEFDADALGIEVELLTDWYWPAIKGDAISRDDLNKYMAIWNELFQTVLKENSYWVLRDYHSPNLILMHGTDVGVIDFQDAQRGHSAYDLVSLLQDARLTVPEGVESDLLGYYCAEASRLTPNAEFDEEAFRTGYAILGAQRACKLLGIFVRLAKRDGKHHYLAHIPRIWAYLERNLKHSALGGLESWLGEHFPKEMRMNPIKT